MSAPVLGPSERAAWEAIKQWAASAFCLDSETPEDAARNVTATINALLAAEPGCTCGEINARHCPAHNEPEADRGLPDTLREMPDGAGTSPEAAAPAPDAELERLLGAMQAACYDHAKGYDHGFPMDCEACRSWMQTIHAHVEQLCQRREAAVRGEVVGTGVIINQWPHLNSVEVKLDEPASAMFRRWEGTQVALVLRAHPEG